MEVRAKHGTALDPDDRKIEQINELKGYNLMRQRQDMGRRLSSQWTGNNGINWLPDVLVTEKTNV